MSNRLTAILGWLTLIAVLGALWVLFGEDPSLRSGVRGGLLYENGSEQIGKTDRILISKGGQTLGILKADNAWVLATRDDFPADEVKVRALLRGLILSKRREPKTGNRQRFDKLDLSEDKALTVRLLDSGGEDITSLLVGKRSEGATGRSLTYVYREGDSRAWLVGDIPALTADPADWLLGEQLGLDQVRLKAVDFGAYAFNRASAGETAALTRVPEGREADADWKITGAYRALSGLAYVDVKALGNPLFEPAGTLTLDTFDGLQVTLTTYKLGDGDEGLWFALSADYSVERAGTAGEAGEIEGAPADGAAEAARLNEVANGWLFKASNPLEDILSRGVEEYLVPLPDEASPDSEG